jgi:hypothetical protein
VRATAACAFNVKPVFILITDDVHLVSDCVLSAAMLLFAQNADRTSHKLIPIRNAFVCRVISWTAQI